MESCGLGQLFKCTATQKNCFNAQFLRLIAPSGWSVDLKGAGRGYRRLLLNKTMAPQFDRPNINRLPSKISSSFQSLAQISPPPFTHLSSLMYRSGEHVNVTNCTRKGSGRGLLGQILSITNVLILVWLCTIWWGESLVFKASLAACQWDQWEQWVSDVHVI